MHTMLCQETDGWPVSCYLSNQGPVICLIKLAQGAASGCPASAVCLLNQMSSLGERGGFVSRDDLSDSETASTINRQLPLSSRNAHTYTETHAHMHNPGGSSYFSSHHIYCFSLLTNCGIFMCGNVPFLEGIIWKGRCQTFIQSLNSLRYYMDIN